MTYRTVIVSAAFAVLLVSPVVAADKPSKESGASEKPPSFNAKCPAQCDFYVRSPDKAEVAAMVKQHAQTQHGTALTDKELEKIVKQPKKKAD